MTVTLLSITTGYQVIWSKPPDGIPTVLEYIEDTQTGPNRSIPCEVKAQKALIKWRQTNLFDSTIKPKEQAILKETIAGTAPGWQFYRQRWGNDIYAWKDVWGIVAVNGHAPELLKARSAQKLAQRIRLYQEGRRLVKGRVGK